MFDTTLTTHDHFQSILETGLRDRVVNASSYQGPGPNDCLLTHLILRRPFSIHESSIDDFHRQPSTNHRVSLPMHSSMTMPSGIDSSWKVRMTSLSPWLSQDVNTTFEYYTRININQQSSTTNLTQRPNTSTSNNCVRSHQPSRKRPPRPRRPTTHLTYELPIPITVNFT